MRGFGNTQKGVQLIATKSWKAMAREPDTGHVQSSAVLPTGKFNLLCFVVIICLALGMPLSSLEPPRHTHHIPPDSFIQPPPELYPQHVLHQLIRSKGTTDHGRHLQKLRQQSPVESPRAFVLQNRLQFIQRPHRLSRAMVAWVQP